MVSRAITILGESIEMESLCEDFSIRLPVLDGKNYHRWAVMMRPIFNFHEVMEIVEEGISDVEESTSKEKDCWALSIIHQCVNFEILGKIGAAKNAKQAWEMLQQTYQGTAKQSDKGITIEQRKNREKGVSARQKTETKRYKSEDQDEGDRNLVRPHAESKPEDDISPQQDQRIQSVKKRSNNNREERISGKERLKEEEWSNQIMQNHFSNQSQKEARIEAFQKEEDAVNDDEEVDEAMGVFLPSRLINPPPPPEEIGLGAMTEAKLVCQQSVAMLKVKYFPNKGNNIHEIKGADAILLPSFDRVRAFESVLAELSTSQEDVKPADREIGRKNGREVVVTDGGREVTARTGRAQGCRHRGGGRSRLEGVVSVTVEELPAASPQTAVGKVFGDSQIWSGGGTMGSCSGLRAMMERMEKVPPAANSCVVVGAIFSEKTRCSAGKMLLVQRFIVEVEERLLRVVTVSKKEMFFTKPPWLDVWEVCRSQKVTSGREEGQGWLERSIVREKLEQLRVNLEIGQVRQVFNLMGRAQFHEERKCGIRKIERKWALLEGGFSQGLDLMDPVQFFEQLQWDPGGNNVKDTMQHDDVNICVMRSM